MLRRIQRARSRPEPVLHIRYMLILEIKCDVVKRSSALILCDGGSVSVITALIPRFNDHLREF